MNSFTGIFQGFYLDFQIIYSLENLWMALSTSEYAALNRIYMNSIKRWFKGETTYIYGVEFQKKTLINTNLFMGSNIILRTIYVEVDREKKGSR